jgi:hypothetical protein
MDGNDSESHKMVIFIIRDYIVIAGFATRNLIGSMLYCHTKCNIFT